MNGAAASAVGLDMPTHTQPIQAVFSCVRSTPPSSQLSFRCSSSSLLQGLLLPRRRLPSLSPATRPEKKRSSSQPEPGRCELRRSLPADPDAECRPPPAFAPQVRLRWCPAAPKVKAGRQAGREAEARRLSKQRAARSAAAAAAAGKQEQRGMSVEGIARFFRNSLRRRSSRTRDEPPGAIVESKPVPAERPKDRNSFYSAGGQHFFEYLVVVSLKKNTKGDYEPKITYQFPKRENLMRGQREEEERLLQAMPLFCFPDGNEWAPLTEYTSETFSFVLTNVDGSRKIGYCRRLLPAGRGARLPEVYCIISCLGCFGLFSKILDEVEKRRQISAAVIYPFMQGLRESPFPAPGKTVTIKSFIPDSGTELLELTRPLDSRLEHVEFQALLQCLSPEKILLIFASAALERRIVFLADELSSLSKCIHAAAALLYPFTWAHTYIPVVPETLLCTVCCPTPFMVGIQKRYLKEVLEQPMEEVLVVDLCEGKFLEQVGDEEEILPPKLQSEMLSSLPTMNNNIKTSEELNAHVSDTFVNFFVKMIGHYPSHIKWNRNSQGCFQERSFCKALTSKTSRRFLKRFVKTQMFSLFIQEAEKSRKCVEGYFQQKLNEYQEQKKPRKLS